MSEPTLESLDILAEKIQELLEKFKLEYIKANKLPGEENEKNS